MCEVARAIQGKFRLMGKGWRVIEATWEAS